MTASVNAMPEDELTLYGYWRSSASYRVRIALNLKGLSCRMKPIHMVKNGGEQHSAAFRAINPQGLVPVLVHNGQVITQSLAICEYLDECFEQYPLLPAQPLERARTRSMASQIACDIHPLNNLRVTKYLRERHGDAAKPVEWMSHWIMVGFSAIEKQLTASRGRPEAYLDGKPGLFECFLIPQVYNAERFATDLTAFPEIMRLVAECNKLPAFIEAAPENQADAEEV